MTLLLERDSDVGLYWYAQSFGYLEGDLDGRIDAAEEFATTLAILYWVKKRTYWPGPQA